LATRIVIAPLLVALATGVHHPEANAVDVSKDVQQAARERVAQALGGSPSDVELSAEPALDLGGCHFLRATHRKRLGTASGQFAVLSDDRVVDSFAADGASAEAILRHCGTNATPDWWAEVVTRFGGVGGVLVDPKNAPSAIRRISEAGETYAAPAFDASRRAVTFFVIHYEENKPYKVEARLPDTAGIEIRRTRLEPRAK
jgi:hypothetical protein